MVLVDPNNALIMMAKHFHWLPHKEQEWRIAVSKCYHYRVNFFKWATILRGKSKRKENAVNTNRLTKPLTNFCLTIFLIYDFLRPVGCIL